MKFKLNKIPHIVNGLKNQIKSELNLTSKEQEQLFTERRKICNNCSFILPEEDRCGECYCPIDRLVKSENYSCPNNYW